MLEICRLQPSEIINLCRYKLEIEVYKVEYYKPSSPVIQKFVVDSEEVPVSRGTDMNLPKSTGTFKTVFYELRELIIDDKSHCWIYGRPFTFWSTSLWKKGGPGTSIKVQALT